MTFVVVVSTLPHLFENGVQLLLVFGAIFYPLNKRIFPFVLLLQSETLENTVEGLLTVRSDEKLLVLHQLGDSFQHVEVAKGLAQGS